MPSVQRYTPDHKKVWDGFVNSAKNATFLFRRDYMDYHAERFADHSLMVERGGRLVALLPANREGEVLYSHGGLSYGGLIVDQEMTTPLMLEVFAAVATQAREAGLEALCYKTVPTIYHRLPAEEDRYALFRTGARLFRRDVLSVLDPAARGPCQKRRRRAAAKAAKSGLDVIEEAGLDEFWTVLDALLQERHGAKPVHSLDEMAMLKTRFPEEIRLFTARHGSGGIEAGVLIYESLRVAHVQYMATTAAGRANGALDLVLGQLLDEVFSAKPWFDFGVSNEDQGQVLNQGLIDFKEGFGARAVSHDFYRLDLAAGLA